MSKSHKQKAEKSYNSYLKKIIKLVGNDTTWASKLNEVGKKLFGKYFIGVYSSDTIPTKIQNKHFLITNLDESNQDGSHWVAIVNDNDRYLFYDSFGRKALSIIPNAKNVDKYIDTELDKEQNISENNCGARSLAFLMVYKKLGYKYAKWI